MGSIPLHYAIGESAVSYACENLNKAKTIDILTNLDGINVNDVNNNGETALLNLLKIGDRRELKFTEAVSLLLEKGADTNMSNNQGETPLNMVAKKGMTEILELML